MTIRWDQFPHERIRLQIYSRLARNDVARSNEDSLYRLLQRRLPSRDADDHRRFIEIEAHTLVEHLRCTRDVYREFVDSQRCKPRIEAHWVVLRFAVFPTALSIVRQRIIAYSNTTTVLAKDLSLLFGIATRSCYRAVDEGIALICLPDLADKTVATDEEIGSLGQLIDEDSLLIFKDIREEGGVVGRLLGGGPFSTDDPRSILSSFNMGPIQAGITLPEWVEIRRQLWHLGMPWTDGLCDLFSSVQEELLAQWRALPCESLIHELELDETKSRFPRIIVPARVNAPKGSLKGSSDRSINGAASKTKSRAGKRRPGRKPKRTEGFIHLAGELWQEAITRGEQTVNIVALREIAVTLDQARHLPPAEYLEGQCAKEIRFFNSRNSHSTNGPIKTWFELVSRGDKDHLRAMRRLLSRCSSRLSGNPMSGN